MTLPAEQRNDCDGRFRLNESYWSLLLKIASNLNIKYGVFVRQSVKLNINLHSNQRVVEQAKKHNMSVEEFAQYAVQQLVEADNKPTPTNGEEILLTNLDGRTKNNFIRVMIALNEMAIAKKGDNLHIHDTFSKKHLEELNVQFDKLGYKRIGETAYKTITAIIKEKL